MNLDDFKPHHIDCDAAALEGNDGRGRIIFLPGSDARALRIAEHFEHRRDYPSPRRFNVYTGTLADGESRVDVASCATGMGTPSVEVVVSELLLLGARRLLRVGTSGSLQPSRVRTGDLVIANSAVRDEHTSDAYAPKDMPAVAHPRWVRALSEAARDLGYQDRCFVGPVHSKDALYGREMGIGPMAAQNAEYMRMLTALGVLCTEMESSALFILAAAHGADVVSLGTPAAQPSAVKAGTVLAVVGDDQAFSTPEQMHEAEGRAIALALEGARTMERLESTGFRA